MKKFIACLLSLLLLAGPVSGPARAENRAVTVVTTIFPIYDWVRQIAGDSENTRLVLLLDNGVDLHSYQPSAQDIVTISTADLFIYVGGESDEWVEDVLAAAMNPDLVSINLLDSMGDAVKAEEIVEGMEHEHENEDLEDHEDHEEEADEHVWLSLRNAETLVAIIADTLCRIDPAYAETYRANASAYAEKLSALDARYNEMVSHAAFDTILFGDRFPFRYLADDYGLTYYAAFSGCSAESEASFATVIFLAQKVDELGLPAVLTIEHPRTRIAETVVQSTASGNQKILTIDSMQGITSQDIQAGVTYLSIMENNLAVLMEALN